MPFEPALLKSLREAKGWSQQELGKEARLSQSIIAKSEKGNNSPGSRVLEKLAQALDCTIDYLHGRGAKYESPAAAAAQMAFEVVQPTLSEPQRDRCHRVLEHPNAPKTAAGWRSFAEMLNLAVGPAPSVTHLAFVKRPVNATSSSSGKRRNQHGRSQ